MSYTDSLSKSGDFFLLFSFFSKKYNKCSGGSFFKFLPRGRTGFFLFLRVQQNLNHMGCSDAIHGWMTGRMDDGTDGWIESFISSTTSFNICKREREMHPGGQGESAHIHWSLASSPS